MFTTEQLTVRWEDQRAIKNLMGKYANCVLLNCSGARSLANRARSVSNITPA